jgi:hypothetical protein
MAVMVAGCVATQTGQSTIQMAETISHIRDSQVLRNISAAIGNRSAVPAQIVLGIGQANVTAGLGSGSGGKYTNINRRATALELDISPSDTWTGQWQFTSITERDDLRRLRNVYELIVSTDAEFDELEDYLEEAEHGKETDNKPESPESLVFEDIVSDASENERNGSIQAETAKPTPKEPSTEPAPSSKSGVIPWEQARDFIENGDSLDCRVYQKGFQDQYWRANGTTQWSPTEPNGKLVVSLGVYQGREIGVTSIACFYDFVIFVQGLTPSASNPANKAGLMLSTP